MKKVRIIVNPISGTKKKKQGSKYFERLLHNSSFHTDFFITEFPGHCTLLSKEAVDLKYDAVIVVGGDGTINEAVQSLIGSKTALGIIPAGSGNGLARHLGIPMATSQAIKRIESFQTTQIDTAKINDQSFVNLSGIGFDAHVAKVFNGSNKRGLFNYFLISIREYFHFKNTDYELDIDGKITNTKAFMVVFANSNQFGNNFIISPNASIKDGLLDVCIIQKPSIFSLPYLFFQLARKKIHHSYFVDIQTACNIKLKLKEKSFINVDGEAIEHKGTVQININPLSLTVII